MSDEKRFCVDCKYHKPTFDDDLCEHPNAKLPIKSRGQDMVTGSWNCYMTPLCRHLREHYVFMEERTCGLNGNWFEPKKQPSPPPQLPPPPPNVSVPTYGTRMRSLLEAAKQRFRKREIK